MGTKPTVRRVEPPSGPGDVRMQSRWELMSYALARLPPKHLPFLAIYAYGVVYASQHKWINTESVGRAAQAIVSVLSMVTGLLLSYRFSTAVSRWEEGKKAWVEVKVSIREAMRILSIPPVPTSQSSPSGSSPIDLGETTDHLPSESDEPDVPPPLRKPRPPAPRAVSTTRRITRSTASMTPEPEPEVSTPTPPPPLRVKSPTRSETANSSWSAKGKERDVVGERVNELAGLFVGFAFALQHHLHGTRPLPQAPLIDLLPPAYLSSLKRTEARVRFASSHAGPSGSASLLGLSDLAPSPGAIHTADPNRPGLRRRGTGPPSREERAAAGADTDDADWDLTALRSKAGSAVSKLAEALGPGMEGDAELMKQLRQMNRYGPVESAIDDGEMIDLSNISPRANGANGLGNGLPNAMTNGVGGAGNGVNSSPKPKSNLASSNPSNLPLSLLKLMEIYCMGLAEVDKDRGGWSEPKRDRALGIVNKLGVLLGDAERLGSDPPPLPLTIHLTDLLLIYLAALPCAMLLNVEGWKLVLVTVLAGWCLLGLEALVSEVGGVFGGSENHHPLPLFTREILLESIEISPAFNRYYRNRIAGRVGEDDPEVDECDRRNKRGGEEWVPSFS